MKPLFFLSALTLMVDAYWLMGAENFLTVERLDPIVNPGKVSGHVHGVLGGSNFGTTSTAVLRQSQCTSIPIPQDKSNYWFPHLYFQWANGSFSSLNGGAVIYYLFSDPAGNTTAFPDDFRMISGTPTLRTYDHNSFAQQAVTFLCLDFNGVSTRHNGLPLKSCPSGIRAQINFPSCWDGKNVDSPNHQSHVAFLSGGPDQGSCKDPQYPVTLPRIFIEVYWGTGDFDTFRSQAMNTTQPFVFSYGDRTGYGYHADFVNGWDAGVLQNAVNNCHCNIYGDPTCCVQQGIFGMNHGQTCRITSTVDEQVLGTIPKLPGNNPVQEEGTPATMSPASSTPAIISPVYAYTGQEPTQTGHIVSQATDFPVPASPTHLGNTPSVSQSTSLASGVLNSSYPVLLPTSLSPLSHSGTPEASVHTPSVSVHTPSVSVPHTHPTLKPSGTPSAQPPHSNCHDGSGSESHSPPHSTPSSTHTHIYAAGNELAAPTTQSPVKPHHTSHPHHGLGSNGGTCSTRRKSSHPEEPRSSDHAAHSHHNAGLRFMRHYARTF